MEKKLFRGGFKEHTFAKHGAYIGLVIGIIVAFLITGWLWAFVPLLIFTLLGEYIGSNIWRENVRNKNKS